MQLKQMMTDACLYNVTLQVYGVAKRVEVRCCDFWDSSAPAEVRSQCRILKAFIGHAGQSLSIMALS